MTRLRLNELDVVAARICHALPISPCHPSECFCRFQSVQHLSLRGSCFAERRLRFAGRGQRIHQRSDSACQCGLISLSAEELASCDNALTGRQIPLWRASTMLRPAREEILRFQSLFGQACHLAESRKKLIERPEVARAIEQEMLQAIIHCLATNETDDNRKTRHHRAAAIVRFEEALSERLDQKTARALCEDWRGGAYPAAALRRIPRCQPHAIDPVATVEQGRGGLGGGHAPTPYRSKTPANGQRKRD
jgi:hypothetical protein